MQLHRPDAREEFEILDAQIVVVSFASLEKLQKWVPYFQTSFLEPYYRQLGGEKPDNEPFSRTRFVADPDLTVYRAYGLGRNSPFKVYGAKIIWQYAQWVAQGKPVKKAEEDTLQRGGDFVIARDGRLTLSYVGEDQADRPAVAEVLAALRLAIER